MAARDDHAQDGVVLRVVQQFRLFQEGTVEMALKMIDSDDGFPAGGGQPFGVGIADQQGGNQARMAGDGHAIQCLHVKTAFPKRGGDDGLDVLEMLSCRQFRNHPAVCGVELDLAADDAGKHFVPIPHNGGGGFIATTLNPQD